MTDNMGDSFAMKVLKTYSDYELIHEVIERGLEVWTKEAAQEAREALKAKWESAAGVTKSKNSTKEADTA